MNTTQKNVCERCKRSFTTKQYLQSHLKRKTLCTQKHICDKCGKEFTAPSKLNAHKNRKTPCAPNEIPIIKTDNSDNRCRFCNKTYFNRYNLQRHVVSCPMRNNQAAIFQLLEKKDKELAREKEMNALLRENIQLRDQLAIHHPQTVINNTLNVQNIYMNVTICSFGNEDLKSIDTGEVMKLLEGDAEEFMPKMIEHIHANPKRPEFHNVFYDPVREKAIVFAPISETEMSWQRRDFNKVSAELTKRIKDHMHPTSGPYFNMAMQNKDSETSNKIINIANSMDWSSDEALAKQKAVLTKVAQNEDFRKLVDIDE